jgi:hypothetical protein
MAQIILGGKTAGSNVNAGTELDPMFTELYRIWNQSHFDAANSCDRIYFNGTAGSYITFQGTGVSMGDLGTADNAFGGGSPTDFAITSRGGSLDFGTGSTRRGRFDTSGNLLINRSAQSSGGKVEITGNLVLQPAAAAPTLGTNGDMSFQLVSNTSLKIMVRGSDGVTRSNTLTLA